MERVPLTDAALPRGAIERDPIADRADGLSSRAFLGGEEGPPVAHELSRLSAEHGQARSWRDRSLPDAHARFVRCRDRRRERARLLGAWLSGLPGDASRAWDHAAHGLHSARRSDSAAAVSFPFSRRQRFDRARPGSRAHTRGRVRPHSGGSCRSQVRLLRARPQARAGTHPTEQHGCPSPPRGCAGNFQVGRHSLLPAAGACTKSMPGKSSSPVGT